MMIPTPRSAQRGKMLSSTSCSSRVYRIASKKKSMSKRSRNRFLDIQSGADPLDRAGIAQFLERPPAAGGELAEIGVNVGRTSVAPGVEIVDQQEIDAVDAEAL